MIHYLIYSSICLVVLLLFYHIVLAREKIYQINRYFLLFSLIFSLVIPLIPVGMTSSLLNLGSRNKSSKIVSSHVGNTNTESAQQVAISSSNNYSTVQASNANLIYPIVLGLYCAITLFLLLRMIWYLFRMRLRTLRNPAISYKNHKVVLLNEDVVPHTFGETIFVNKDQYEKGEISDDVMAHELIHASQTHSLDILLVEILKTIGWFNPFLYFYKSAIQLNHEYIADEKVLANGTDVADYQSLLLNMCATKPVHYLSTSFNYKITKKRFKMMTKNKSTYRSYLKIALILPLFLILGVLFGCNPKQLNEGQQKQMDQQSKIVNVEFVNSHTVKINGNAVPLSDFGAAFSSLDINFQKATVKIKMPESVPSKLRSGMLIKIQKVLQKQGALRIDYAVSQPKTNQTKKIQSRNLLSLYINDEGDIFADQNQISLSSVKGYVKKFVTNDGKLENLSESPKDAIISIKADEATPYKTYRNTLSKVMKAYSELRNKASMKLFNQPFQSLEKGSRERKRIKTMYPKQISIEPI